MEGLLYCDLAEAIERRPLSLWYAFSPGHHGNSKDETQDAQGSIRILDFCLPDYW